MSAPNASSEIVQTVKQAELVRVSRLFDVPGFVKTANVATTIDPEHVPVVSYADKVARELPCHTAAATWVSNAIFQTTRDNYGEKRAADIEHSIFENAKYFGVLKSCQKVKYAAESMQKEASVSDDHYAWVWEADTGEKERFYPLQSVDQIKVATEWLEKERDVIPFADRQVVATKIIKAATDLQVTMPLDAIDFLERQTGRGIPDFGGLPRMFDSRIKLAKDQKTRDKLSSLAEAVKTAPSMALQEQNLMKLAQTIETVDHAIGIRGKYTDVIPRAEDVLFAESYTKTAESINSLCELQTGAVYQKDQLAKVSRDSLESVFGTDFTNEVCTGLDVDSEKMAAVASTLPRPDAELLESLLTEARQEPQMKIAAAFDRPSDSDFRGLAAAY